MTDVVHKIQKEIYVEKYTNIWYITFNLIDDCRQKI